MPIIFSEHSDVAIMFLEANIDHMNDFPKLSGLTA
jgi:hypothetical protein